MADFWYQLQQTVTLVDVGAAAVKGIALQARLHCCASVSSLRLKANIDVARCPSGSNAHATL